ncbi:tyrosine-type recombinase/integrase [Sphingomonas sp. RT2P30]|uniref:tyrosine-type recombinase/integrase n=1 Tax=Parasphingomonas halimpatiens TaxID=3096162 RepID=UPI002FCBC9D3
MATVKKRAWRTASGEQKEAWRVRYVDQHSKTLTRQFALKRDADAFRVKAEGEVAAGVHTPDSTSVTVAEAASIWITNSETNGLGRGTLKAYREMVDLHIAPLLGKEKLARLTAPKVVQFVDAMKATRSMAMTRKAVRHLSMILNEAQRRGLVAQNVAAGVKVKRTDRDVERVTIPPKEHLRAIIEAADRLGNEDPRLPILVRVPTFTGLRQGELRALAWPSVELVGEKVEVGQSADRWNDIGAPKSAAARRSIPIGKSLIAALRKWKLQCPPSKQDLVFPNERGGVLDQKGIGLLFLKVQIAAGLAIDSGKKDEDGNVIWKPRYGFHDLRHAAASAWINQRVDLKRLQVWMGHATIQLTLDTYGHLIVDAEADAALADSAERALLG